MNTPPTALQEQFSEMPQQKQAATLGMWTFLATEVLFFGAMFLAYLIYRRAYPEAFALAGRETIVLFGTINTAILLTSSLTMAFAVQSAKDNETRALVKYLLVTVLFGIIFLSLKAVEYHKDLDEHLWPGPHFKAGLPPEAQIFWFLYWVMTGVHAIHVTVGVVLLSIMAWLSRQGRFSDAYHTPIEIIGLYWHFVDVIWIFLYPLLYLVHRFS